MISFKYEAGIFIFAVIWFFCLLKYDDTHKHPNNQNNLVYQK